MVIPLHDLAYGALHQSVTLTDGLLVFACPNGEPDLLVADPDGHLLRDVQQHASEPGS